MAERQKPRLLQVQVVNEDGTTSMKTVREDQIRTGGPARSSLTPTQRARAEDMHARFIHRMVPSPLADFITNLEKESDPDAEMDVWEQMGRVADKLWDHPISKPFKRKQIDHAVIAASVHAVDIPAQTGVSDELVTVMRQFIAEDQG